MMIMMMIVITNLDYDGDDDDDDDDIGNDRPIIQARPEIFFKNSKIM